MKPEAQRIAIAEFCGWTKCRLAVNGAGAPERKPSPHGVPPKRNYEAPLPDYCKDLNAIHEATKKLDFELDYTHDYHLLKIAGSLNGQIHATAAQRAEALLKTIGKWQAEPKAPNAAKE